jgi:hypothetical protein
MARYVYRQSGMTKQTTIREGGRLLVVEQIVGIRGNSVTVKLVGEKGTWTYPASALRTW